MEEPLILTNHSGRDKSPTWAKLTQSFDRKRPTPWRVLNNFVQAWGLFRARSGYKAVVLGGGTQADMFYLTLQRLWPFGARPIIKIDCLWYKSSGLKHFFKRRLFKWVDKAVDRYVVWARRETIDYPKVFGLPPEKFIFIPYHTTVDLGEISPRNGNHLFSGGNFARDYRTLAAAVRGLDFTVVVACTNSKVLEGIDFPSNVKVVDASHREFMQLMAESSINVVPLKNGLLHSGGQQTFLNAMVMGKPVIVTDPEGAKDYIEDGVDGILVPPAKPERLRSAIVKLHHDPDLAVRLGEAAREKALKWDTEANLAAIAVLAQEVINKREVVKSGL